MREVIFDLVGSAGFDFAALFFAEVFALPDVPRAEARGADLRGDDLLLGFSLDARSREALR